MSQRKPSILRWEERKGGAFGYLGDIRVAKVYSFGGWSWQTVIGTAPGRKAYGKGISEAYCRRQAEAAIQHWLDAAGLAVKAAVE